MSRRAYDDAKDLGRSNLVPFVPGEGAGDRHARRKEVNESYKAEVQAFCDTHGITLSVKNEGHHWRFVKDSHSCDWWPSSAKLVFKQKFEKGLHAHDWQKVIREIKKRWSIQ